MHTYIHTYITLPTYIHTHIHTSIHKYTNTYIHTILDVCSCFYFRARAMAGSLMGAIGTLVDGCNQRQACYVYTILCTIICICTYIHICIYIYIYTHTHVSLYTFMHYIYIYKDIRIPIRILIYLPWWTAATSGRRPTNMPKHMQTHKQ